MVRPRADRSERADHKRMVIREAGSGTRSAFEAALERFGLTSRLLNVALELPSNEAVRAAVGAGMRGGSYLSLGRGAEPGNRAPPSRIVY